MSTAPANLFKRAASFVQNLSLVQRALLLFLLPAVVQAVILFGLVILEIETADFDPRRRVIERQINDAIVDFYLQDWAILREMKRSIEQNQPLPNSCMEMFPRLTKSKERLDAYWTSYPSRIHALTLFFLRGRNEYENHVKTSNDNKNTFGAIYQATQKAILACSERTTAFQTHDPGSELKTAAEANTAHQQAYDQLLNRVRVSQGEPFRPEEGTRLRWFWSTILLIYSGVDLVILVVAGILFVRDLILRLESLRQNSERLLVGRELLPRMSGSDEIARLDNDFHDMKEAIDNSTEAHKLMMEGSTELMCSIDKGGRIVSISKAAESIIGHRPEDLMGTRLIEVIREDAQQRFLEKIKEVISKQSRTSFEAPAVSLAGKTVELLWSVAYFSADDSVFCITHDVTDAKRAEQMQQELVQMVSHDLRSPLTSIAGFYEFAERGVLGSFNQDGVLNLGIAKRNTRDMLTLVNDLLEVERLDSGMLEVTRTRCPITEIVGPALEAIQSQAIEKNVSIQLRNTVSEVYGDPPRLVQVVANMLSTVIKMLPANGTISIEVVPDKNDTRFSFISSGNLEVSGSEEAWPGTERSDSPYEKKSALGLKVEICKALVALHGGRIEQKEFDGGRRGISFCIPRGDLGVKLDISLTSRNSPADKTGTDIHD